MQVAPDSEDYCFNAVVWRDQFRHNRPESVEEGPYGLRYKLGLTAVSQRLSELDIIFQFTTLSSTSFQHVY
jgi:hypothetical protein